MSEKRPLNGFFVCIYYLVNLVAGILHPVTIIGRENLPCCVPTTTATGTRCWWR